MQEAEGLLKKEIIEESLPDTQKISGSNYFGSSCSKHIFKPNTKREIFQVS
jgi:hypothetical protein